LQRKVWTKRCANKKPIEKKQWKALLWTFLPGKNAMERRNGRD